MNDLRLSPSDPAGLCPKAQGCRTAATLGHDGRTRHQPQRVASFDRSQLIVHAKDIGALNGTVPLPPGGENNLNILLLRAALDIGGHAVAERIRGRFTSLATLHSGSLHAGIRCIGTTHLGQADYSPFCTPRSDQQPVEHTEGLRVGSGFWHGCRGSGLVMRRGRLGCGFRRRVARSRFAQRHGSASVDERRAQERRARFRQGADGDLGG